MSMASCKYSITLSSFKDFGERIDKTIERLTQQGYDGLEMIGEPVNVNMKSLQDILRSFNMPVCGITGMWGSSSTSGPDRRLLSSRPHIIKSSEEYVRRCVEMCQLLGGQMLNICLFADDEVHSFDRTHCILTKDQKSRLIDRVIPLLRKLTVFARNHGIELLLEPLNRYSTPFCTTASDAIDLANKINQDNFGILLDTFHMNIEEDSFDYAILKSKTLLHHMHFADNNRKMPGYAHINFGSIMSNLARIGYSEYISFEPSLTLDNYTWITKNGLDFIKNIEQATRRVRAHDC
jgi:D-psicose/D-tagatose/L-ribulose 3-epimerase